MKDIIVVLCSSRGGSSLFKELLMQHPEISGLAGEEEPYLRLTGNCYPFNPDDGFIKVHRPNMVRQLIEAELNEKDLRRAWERRLDLQFPGRRYDIGQLSIVNPWPWLEERGIARYYDGCREERGLDPAKWDIRHKYEEPPFVMPIVGRGTDHPVVFKSPSNAYRIGWHKSVWPEANVRYIWLQRNPWASINGLLEGWESKYGFFSHYIPGFGWWKFDLHPGWDKDSLVEITAAKQWSIAHRTIWDFYDRTRDAMVKFEWILENVQGAMDEVFNWIGVGPYPIEMPRPVMATSPPDPDRWKRREKTINSLVDCYCKDLVDAMGYRKEEV